MTLRLSIAFVLALTIALAGNAAVRRSSQRRRNRGEGGRAGRDLGGVAVIAAVLVGGLVGTDLTARLVTVAVSATALAALGQVRGPRHRTVRSVATLAAAGAVVVAGVRLEPLGTGWLAAVFSALWIAAVADGFRRLDANEGVTATVALASASGAFAIAAFAGQEALAALAAATIGACLGLLAFNLPPASTFLGARGSLFVGFVVAVEVTEAAPASTALGRLVAPVLLVAVALLELLVVVIGRARRGEDLALRGRDHLFHRLVLRGVGPLAAVAVLGGIQVLTAAIAVGVGRGVLDATAGAAIGFALASPLLFVALGTRARAHPDDRRRRAPQLLLAGAAVAIVATLAMTAYAGERARAHVDDGRAAVDAALRAARNGDIAVARAHFARARAAFDRAGGWLEGPWAWPGRLLPVVGPNLEAVSELADVSGDVARAGQQLAAETNQHSLRIEDGTLPLDEIRQVTPRLARGAAVLDAASRRIDAIDEKALVGPVEDALIEARDQLDAARREARNGADAARLAPALFGGDGPRRYFVAVQNTAEARGTGGIIGNWGILEADDGKLTFGEMHRAAELNAEGETPEASGRTLDAPDEFVRRYSRFAPTQILQNVNMSPDFPTVGKVITGLYPESGGETIDGVIAIDPEGLAALLELTGPITMPDWPEPISAENAVRITLADAYERFAFENRVEFIGDVADTALERATTGDLGEPATIGRVLGTAARQGHLMVYLARAEEQTLARRVGAAGAIPRVRSDTLTLVTQNAAGNKLDYFLHRHLRYDLSLRPVAGSHRARVDGRVRVRLENEAPASGLAQYRLGPFDERFAAGENRSYVSVYTPLGFAEPTLDGAPTALEADTELHRRVASTYVRIPATGHKVLAFDVGGEIALGAGGWYALDLGRQPALHPDDVRVDVAVPRDWHIVDAIGLEMTNDHTASAHLALQEPTTLWLRVAPGAGRDGVWSRLLDGAPGPAPSTARAFPRDG